MSEGLAFDHVIYGTNDLDAAARLLKDEYGLVAEGGGVHPGGTKNLGVRFADRSYLELLAVNDQAHPMSRWLTRQIADGDRLVGWALKTTDIEAVAKRVGMTPRTGSIERPDGTIGTWRTIVYERAADARPFFIQYDGRSPEEVQSDVLGIAWVEVGGDCSWIDSWLSDVDLDIRVVEGEPRLLAVGLGKVDGELVIR